MCYVIDQPFVLMVLATWIKIVRLAQPAPIHLDRRDFAVRPDPSEDQLVFVLVHCPT